MYSNKLTDGSFKIFFTSIGDYEILLKGGFKVSYRTPFKIKLIDNKTNTQVKLKRTIGVNEFVGMKRTVKICKFVIEEIGEYELVLNNTDGVQLFRSRLFLYNLIFRNGIAKNLREIIIRRC